MSPRQTATLWGKKGHELGSAECWVLSAELSFVSRQWSFVRSVARCLRAYVPSCLSGVQLPRKQEHAKCDTYPKKCRISSHDRPEVGCGCVGQAGVGYDSSMEAVTVWLSKGRERRKPSFWASCCISRLSFSMSALTRRR